MSDNTATAEPIYHIAEPERWRSSADDEWYSPDSLADEGFVHCSYGRQVQRSLDKFFSGHDEVVVLQIDPLLLTNELRIEQADGDAFPHVYGEINVDAVVAAEYVARDETGMLRFNTRRE